MHCVQELAATDVTRIDDIPVTTVARTLLDLAAYLNTHDLERLVATAERAGLASREALLFVLTAYPRRAGAAKLKSLVQSDVSFTRSDAESRLLALIRKVRLPEPATNVRVHGYEVDFLWRSARLVVEVDGYAYHESRASFEQDRRRDAHLIARGMRVMRFTWRQFTREPEATLVQIAQALAATGNT